MKKELYYEVMCRIPLGDDFSTEKRFASEKLANFYIINFTDVPQNYYVKKVESEVCCSTEELLDSQKVRLIELKRQLEDLKLKFSFDIEIKEDNPDSKSIIVKEVKINMIKNLGFLNGKKELKVNLNDGTYFVLKGWDIEAFKAKFFNTEVSRRHLTNNISNIEHNLNKFEDEME